MQILVARTAMNAMANRNPAAIIGPEKYPAVHEAVLNACDTLDGVKDGVLENPLRCRFDPKVLECKGTDGPSCLTPPQVETARMIYAPRAGWTIGAATIIDLARRDLDRLEATIDLQIGEGWRFQYIGSYDGFTRRVVHDRASITRIFCDCLGVSLTHLGARGETWLEFWLTAVPWGRGRIGLGGRGNLLFDQPLPYFTRP